MNKLTTDNRTTVVSYVPHGVNSDVFKPTEVPDDFYAKLFGNQKYDFILFWSNRNIRRKQASDVIYAFKMFTQSLSKEDADKVCLVMHTKPIDENGTDLKRVVSDMASSINVIFSEGKLTPEELNYLYNIVDCTINIAVNEGFGLTTAESVMAGTPIIVNVTGGLQDQCGFSSIYDDQLLDHNKYITIGTVSNRRVWSNQLKWGEWVYPVWSSSHSLNGSLPTPYIWEDRVDLYDVSQAIMYMYCIGRDERKRIGLVGRDAFINQLGLSHSNMNSMMIQSIETTLENWTPRNKFDIYKL